MPEDFDGVVATIDTDAIRGVAIKKSQRKTDSHIITISIGTDVVLRYGDAKMLYVAYDRLMNEWDRVVGP